MALREKDDTSSSRRPSQKQILLSMSVAEPTSGMQGTLTRAERDPCDASHDYPARGFSDLRPSFGRRTRVRQQWIGGLSQAEACQALGKLGKVHRELGFVRGAGAPLAFLCGRDIRLRFAWHPCIASEKKFGRTSGLQGSASRMAPKKRRVGGNLNLAPISGSTACLTGRWPGGDCFRTAPSPFGPVAASPHRATIDCHNLHGVKSRGIPASKLLRCSTDTPEMEAGTQRASFCIVGAYPIPSKAHEFCYPVVDSRSLPLPTIG